MLLMLAAMSNNISHTHLQANNKLTTNKNSASTNKQTITQNLKTAPAILKQLVIPQNQQDLRLIEESIQALMRSKGFSTKAAQLLNSTDNSFNKLVSDFLLRLDDSSNFHLDDQQISSSLHDLDRVESSKMSGLYHGSVSENQEIDSAILKSGDAKDSNQLGRLRSINGASPFFDIKHSKDILKDPLLKSVAKTPILILGAGPAGMMLTRALIELGFDQSNITIIDKKGEFKGIWKLPNVNQGSKNNPVPFNFMGVNLTAAPGPASDVLDFLDAIEGSSSNTPFQEKMNKPLKAKVTSVDPGNLEHKVTIHSNGKETELTAPIVINTLGLGEPLPINDPARMTSSSQNCDAGKRMQINITDEIANKLRNKSVVLIGLGNSTAEMLVQLQNYNKKGYKIDYNILTHYPEDSINNPEQNILGKNGKSYKVFRETQNPKNPDLVNYEGDLQFAKDAYEEARSEGRIFSDISHWTRNRANKSMTLIVDKGNINPHIVQLKCDELFTLIGLKQSPQAMQAMGIELSDEAIPQYDFDGEFHSKQKTNTDRELNKGYFGLGAILNNPHDKNSIVMPGIMHRVRDLIFGVVMRATEYQINDKVQGIDTQAFTSNWRSSSRKLLIDKIPSTPEGNLDELLPDIEKIQDEVNIFINNDLDKAKTQFATKVNQLDLRKTVMTYQQIFSFLNHLTRIDKELDDDKNKNKNLLKSEPQRQLKINRLNDATNIIKDLFRKTWTITEAALDKTQKLKNSETIFTHLYNSSKVLGGYPTINQPIKRTVITDPDLIKQKFRDNHKDFLSKN